MGKSVRVIAALTGQRWVSVKVKNFDRASCVASCAGVEGPLGLRWAGEKRREETNPAMKKSENGGKKKKSAVDGKTDSKAISSELRAGGCQGEGKGLEVARL